ncbi:MAG: hypothetical protein HYW45_03190 [Candidatus Daviesbacteria bacterium]|nr:MAG: hypothetical protein HYW45_03190 [Candidatus Daviesbacteria bacterium]
MQKSSLTLIKQAHELSGLVSEALEKHGSTDEVVAGLRMVEELGRSSRVILEGSGGTIFPNGSNQETAPVVAPVNEATVAEVVKPTTFAQLLKLRVAELFDPQVPTVSREQIEGAVRGRGLRKAFEAVGIPFTAKTLDRGSAINIAYICLTTPGEKFKPGHSFNRRYLTKTFLFPKRLQIAVLFSWASEIGYNWHRNPTVNVEEAIGIRGLAILESRIAKV